MNKMSDSEKLNHTYWELAFAMGWVKAGENIEDVSLEIILTESLKYIEKGHRYEGLED